MNNIWLIALLKRLNKGFSLVELLVVISIVGILAAAGFASYTSANQQARNGRRRADVEKLRSALEMYRSEHGVYPPLSATSDNNNGSWDDLMTALGSYLHNETITDPKKEGYDEEPYQYRYAGGGRTGTHLGQTQPGSYKICIDIEPLSEIDNTPSHAHDPNSQECFRQPD